MNTLLVMTLGWLLLVIVFLSLRSLGRSLEDRERMAMSARGSTPPDTRRRKTLPQPLLLRRTGILQGGMMTTLVGLALTLGLSPIGCIVTASQTPARGGSSHLGPKLRKLSPGAE